MNDLTEQILGLQQGDHLCMIYERDPAEQMPALIPFIKQGLASGERCIYIADDQTVEEVAQALKENGIDIDREVEQGALLLWTRAEWRQPGDLDSEKKAAQVKHFIDAARAAGFSGIRFAVEMTWTLGPNISAERLRHWEATINKIFVPGFPGKIICQYSRSRISPEVVLTSLSTHPLAIIGQTVHQNFFYEAPLILGGPSETGRLDWLISQLQKSHQLAERREEDRGSRLKQIYRLTHQINRADALDEIYKASLDILQKSVKADRAAILLYDPDGVLRFKSSYGLSEGYRRAVEGHSPWKPDAPDPQPVCLPDIDRAPLGSELKEVVRNEGIRAIAFFPLVSNQRLLGKFMIYYNSAHAFLEEEVALAQSIAGHIALSIQSRRAEEALRQSQEQLTIALGAGRMGVWEWDIPAGRIAWTAGLEAIHGMPAGTYGGRFEDFKRAIHPEDLERVSATIEKTLQNRDRNEYQIEYRIVRPDREVVWLESRGRLFLNATGEPERMAVVCIDITERKRMEEALRQKTVEAEQASELKSQLVSNVSHELRTPLNAILGYTHLLISHLYGPVSEEQKVALNGVVRNAEDLLNLVNNLLDLSKIESGKIAPEVGPVDLSRLCDEILAGLEPLLNRSALTFRYDKPTLPIIFSDVNKVRQILVNLLSNAIKFTQKGGVTIRMEDQPEREEIEICVRDTGIGIAPENLPKIFDAFHQVDGTATREFGGSGLGLTIVKQLIDVLKGTIRVESEVGKGTAFTFSLPYRLISDTSP